MRKNWRAGPPNRGPGSETQPVLPCRASPARLIRAKNGPGQNGPGWPVLTPLPESSVVIPLCFSMCNQEHTQKHSTSLYNFFFNQLSYK